MATRAPVKTRSKTDQLNKESLEQEPLEVFCRVKPPRPGEEIGVVALSDETVRLSYPGKESEARDHRFTRVFGGDSAQQEVFDTVALPLVADALKGKSGLLFTYGVTGSGKTFTMTGTNEEIGIIPRTMDVIFNSIRSCNAMKGVITPDGQNGFVVSSIADALDRKQKDMYKVPKTPGGFRRRDDAGDNRVHDTTFCRMEAENVVSVFASYVENHETKIYDLLDDQMIDPIRKIFPTKGIRDVPNMTHAFIKDLVEIEVNSAQEALDVLNLGQKRRTTAATALNSESSRGHAVFTLRFVQTPVANIEKSKANPNVYFVSQLSLVDLAGSERLGRTNNVGKLRREANNINQSLMTLRNCLEILRDNQMNDGNKPVPFREAKITQLFKGFFLGTGRVRVIVCVNPSLADFDENIHVLRFAEEAQDVKITKPQAPKFDERYFESDDMATGLDFPITMDLRMPLFKSFGSLDRPSSLDFDPKDLLADPGSDMWTHFFQALENRSQARNVTSEMLQSNVKFAAAKVEKLVKEYGGAKSQIATLKDVVEQQKNELDRHKQYLSATAAEKEKLRIDRLRDEREKWDLASQVRAKEAEANAERANLQKTRQEMEAEKQNAIREQIARFEAMNVKTSKREKQLKETMKRLSKIQALAGVDAPLSSSASESDLLSALELERLKEASGSGARPKPNVAPKPSNLVDAAGNLRGPPVANRHHRRSLSEGRKEQWLDHQAKNLAPLGTVFTTGGLDRVRRKSVTKLEMKDVAQSTAYSLTHQQQDSDGDLETYIHKGNVIPTVGGGVQMILTDIEKLTQKSPTRATSRKRFSPVGASGSSDEPYEVGGRALRQKRTKFSNRL